MISVSASFFLVQAVLVLVNTYLQVLLKNLGFSYVLIGIALALAELFGMAGPLATGAFVDRRGHLKGALFASMAVLDLSLVVLLLRSPGFLLPLLAYGMVGFCNKSGVTLEDTAGMQLAGGDVARYTRMRAMGTLGAFVFSVAYTLLHLPSATDNRQIVGCMLAGSVPYLVVVACGRHFSVPGGEGRAPAARGRRWFDRAFVPGVVLIAVSRFAMSATGFMPLYMVDVVGDDRIALMYAFATFSEFGAMFLAGHLVRAKGVSPAVLLSLSSFGVALRLVLYVAFPSVAGVAAGQCMHSLCFGFFQPAMVQFVQDHVAPTDHAKGLGLVQAAGTGLVTMAGNFLGGILIDRFGYRCMFLSFSVVALAGCGLFLLGRRRLSVKDDGFLVE